MAKFRKGQSVTARGQLFMGSVVDVNETYTVATSVNGESTRIVVSADDHKRFYPDAEIVETHTSYLVERNWDGVGVWMTPDDLTAGSQTAAA